MNEKWFWRIIKHILTILLLGVSITTSYSQKQFNRQDTISAYTNLKNHVYTLSNDSLGGRSTGTIYATKTMNYLHNEIHSIINNQYTIKIDTFEYYRDNKKTVTGHNLFAYPQDTVHSVFFIVAHYDHLQPGSPFSNEILAYKKEKIHPGADDNASGVAMALELFRLLMDNTIYNNLNLKPGLILFSGHEDGLFGSKHWCEMHIQNMNISFILNFDMLGRMDRETKEAFIRHANNDSIVHLLFKTANRPEDKVNFCFRNDENNIVFSDAGCFHKNKIPAFTISTGVHEDYHRITDSPEKINYQGMYHVLIQLYTQLSQTDIHVE